jgi:RND family efflux transporter MFP subunit
MNRFSFTLLGLVVILALSISPAAVRAANSNPVTASAIIVPAQVSEVGFLSTAPVREILVKQGDIVQAGQTLATLDTPELEYAVAAADAVYRSAQSFAELQLYRTVEVYDFRGHKTLQTMPREVVLRANSLAEAARASLEVAQASLAQSTLAAPYDATVVAVHVVPGEIVQLDQPVVKLATLDQLQIETTDLSERDISKIKIGQSAAVYVEALDAEFSATIVALAPRAQTVGGDVVYKVTLVFDEQPVGLLWGMTAEVTITVE